MFRRLLLLFLAGRAFRMISGRRKAFGGSAYSRGWGSRHNVRSGFSGLSGLFGGRHRNGNRDGSWY